MLLDLTTKYFVLLKYVGNKDIVGITGAESIYEDCKHFIQSAVGTNIKPSDGVLSSNYLIFTSAAFHANTTDFSYDMVSVSKVFFKVEYVFCAKFRLTLLYQYSYPNNNRNRTS